jgi:hypothetical protein
VDLIIACSTPLVAVDRVGDSLSEGARDLDGPRSRLDGVDPPHVAAAEEDNAEGREVGRAGVAVAGGSAGAGVEGGGGEGKGSGRKVLCARASSLTLGRTVASTVKEFSRKSTSETVVIHINSGMKTKYLRRLGSKP